jgi:hypothetical protein
VDWCEGYPEVAQALNVDSLSLPVLEPYLNAVMRRVQRKLPPDHLLRPSIDWFADRRVRIIESITSLTMFSEEPGIRESVNSSRP